jgi:hypothetical protein
MFFVVFFANLLVYLSGWAVSWGASSEVVADLFSRAPEGWRAMFGPAGDVTRGRQVGAFLVSLWLYGIVLLMWGFVYSYFWTASTILYYLLRREVDATDMDEVYLEEANNVPDSVIESPSPVSRTSAEKSQAAGSEGQEKSSKRKGSAGSSKSKDSTEEEDDG